MSWPDRSYTQICRLLIFLRIITKILSFLAQILSTLVSDEYDTHSNWLPCRSILNILWLPNKEQYTCNWFLYWQIAVGMLSSSKLLRCKREFGGVIGACWDKRTTDFLADESCKLISLWVSSTNTNNECDVYLHEIKQYLKTTKAFASKIGYYLRQGVLPIYNVGTSQTFKYWFITNVYLTAKKLSG